MENIERVPENAICESCKELIGNERACNVREIDEITGEEIGPLYWFHEDRIVTGKQIGRAHV